MYDYPVTFPAVSNRESWVQTVQICDDDTGDPINILDDTGAPLYAVYLEISPPQQYGYSPNYNHAYYGNGCEPLITATLANYLTIPDIGTIQIQIPYTVMQTLRGGLTYNVYFRVEDTAGADARQILIGKLPVAFGGHGS